MPTNPLSPSPEQSPGVASSVLRRSAIVGTILAVLLAVAGLLAYLTRTEPTHTTPHHGAPKPSASPPTPRPSGANAAPPRTHRPTVFAKAAAKALWSYDTRHTSHRAHLAGLARWMTPEKKYADWKSVTEQVPGSWVWSRMHLHGQRATATAGEAHVPGPFKAALAEDPHAITEAYAYAVAVTGHQTLAWKDSGAGAEARTMRLAVQCRPHRPCALAGVLPGPMTAGGGDGKGVADGGL